MKWVTGLPWTALALALGLSACDSAEERIGKHYARGMELLAENAPEKAVLEFRNALKLNENHAPSRFEIAKLYERDGEWKAAVGNYRLTTELDPSNVGAHVRLAQILLAAGDLDSAAGLIDKALALAPEDPDALAASANLLLRRGDAAGATAAAGKALAAAPGHLAASMVVVAERMQAGAYDDALARVDALIDATPTDRTLNLLKLQLLAQAERPEAQQTHLRRMIELFPTEASLRKAMAQQMLAAGDPAGAEAELRVLADLTPDDPEAALDVVRLVGRTRGADAARAELQARVAQAADPAAAFPFVTALAALDYQAGRRDVARAALQAAADDNRDPATARAAALRLAQIDIREGESAAARARIDAVLAADAANAEALQLRATLLIDEDRPADAILDLRAAQDVDPDNTALMLLAARAYQRAGNPDLAGERLATAARTSNFAPDVALAYARFLVETSRPEAAASMLTEAFRRAPRDRGVLAELAALRLQLGDWAGAEEVAAAMRQLTNGAAPADQVVAAALSGRGDHDAGVALLENLAARPETAAGALRGLIAGYVKANRIDDAVVYLDNLLANEPQNVPALLLRADFHNAAREPERAEARLRAVIAAAPSNPIGHAALARHLMIQARYPEADAVLQSGVEATGGAAALRLLRAQTLDAQGFYDAAIAEYEALYELDPNSTMIANNLASLLAEYRAEDPASLDRAARVAQRLRGSTVPVFQDTYGWILYLQGDKEAALRALVPAGEALPDNPFVRYHVGRAYAALGQTELARVNLEAALAIDAGFPKAASARTALEALPAPAVRP